MRTPWRSASVIGVACLMLVACGSDSTDSGTTQSTDPGTAPSATTADTTSSDPTASSDAPASTTPPSSSIDEEADQAAAQAALLQLSDFEPGWSEVASSDDAGQGVVKRKVAECAGSDRDSGLAFGGALAETGTITSPGGDEVIQETVSFAPTVSAATERMAILAAPEFVGCIQPIYEQWINEVLDGTGATLDRVTIGKLNMTPAGDSMVAYRITITAAKGGLTQDLFVDIAVIQSGRVLASTTFQSKNSPFSTDVAGKYVALAASRLPAT